MSEMVGQGKSTKSVFEAMYMKNLQDSQETKQIDTVTQSTESVKAEQLKAKFAKERSLQQYYEDCKFESEVKSFTDFMQS